MRSLFVFTLFAFSFGVLAEPPASNQKQDLKANFGEYIGKWEILACGGLWMQDGMPTHLRAIICDHDKEAEIKIDYGLRGEDPAEALQIVSENPNNKLDRGGEFLAYVGGHPDDLCFSAPGLQYCDTADTFETGVLRFLSEVRFEKDPKDPNIVRIYSSMDKQKQPDGKFFHVAKWLTLKRLAN